MLKGKDVKKLLFIIPACVFLIATLNSYSICAQEEEVLKIGVAAMVSPGKTISVYQQIIYYIGEELGVPVKMVQRKTYAEMDALLKKTEVELAFVCSGPYVLNHEEFEYELLVVPSVHRELVYFSYIIAHKESPIEKFEDLQGKTFAFTDPNSNTGYYFPTYLLAKEGKTPEAYFSKYAFSGHHDTSISIVAEKLIDAAAVDHLIWEYLNKTDTKHTSRTKIIAKSQAFGNPPIVVSSHIDKQLKEKIKTILLKMHENKYGKEILDKIYIDKFVNVDNSHYDSVKEMLEFIKKKAD